MQFKEKKSRSLDRLPLVNIFKRGRSSSTPINYNSISDTLERQPKTETIVVSYEGICSNILQKLIDNGRYPDKDIKQWLLNEIVKDICVTSDNYVLWKNNYQIANSGLHWDLGRNPEYFYNNVTKSPQTKHVGFSSHRQG